MLAELRIQGLGVIDAAQVSLGAGLTVLTGETGAGKTMVVHSLALLLGGRADSGLVRSGSSRAVVEGRLAGLAAAPLERAAETGAELEDGDLLVGRSVGADGGRSRAWLGGVGVPAATLAEVTGAAIVIHGQHDQQRLVRPVEQRNALDRFGGPPLADALTAYQQTYDSWRHAAQGARELQAAAEARAVEADLLRAGLARVLAVAPAPAEDHALRARAERLRNAADLQGAAEGARELLAGDGGTDIVVLAAGARRLLEAVSVHDAELVTLAQRAAEVGLLAADLAGDLASYAAGVESDPAALAAVEDRRAELTALSRLHGPDIDAVLAWQVVAETRLMELDGSDDRGVELNAEALRLDAMLSEQAAAVTRLRTEAARRLGVAVGGELSGLAMAQASVAVSVLPGPRGRHGLDEVEFTLAPHAGAPARPLGRGASGGELSRVMLALEVVLAGAGDAATLIFDEVDAGVGGRAAVEVGRRLARLARTHQVICVTHLPQVAAFADAHVRVAKSVDGSVTMTDVTVLSTGERVVELSRMLGGRDSELARGHAQELLDAAAAERPADTAAERPADAAAERPADTGKPPAATAKPGKRTVPVRAA